MSSVLELISRVSSLEGLGEAGRALIGEVRAQVNGILEEKKTLLAEVKTEREAKRTAEEKVSGLEAELSEAKKSTPSKAKLDKLEMYEALGTPEEIKAKQDSDATALKDLQGKVRKTELADFGLKPVIFDQFFSDVTASYEGEGDEQKVIYKRGDDVVTLEDLAKEKGLEVSDLQSAKPEPEKPDSVRVIEQVGPRKPTPTNLSVEDVVKEKQQSNLYQA